MAAYCIVNSKQIDQISSINENAPARLLHRTTNSPNLTQTQAQMTPQRHQWQNAPET
jgi:hypothetical protein